MIATLGAQQAILSFGTATIGLLTAGAFNVWDDPAVATLIFLGVTPLVSGIVLVVWIGEFIRRTRAGMHLQQIEQAFRNAKPDMPPAVMAWERGLHDSERDAWRRRRDWNYAAVIALFAAIGGGSLVLGAYRGFGYWPEPTVAGAIAGAAVLAAMVGFVVAQLRAARGLRAEPYRRPLDRRSRRR